MSHGAVATVRAVPALSASLKAAHHARHAPPSTLYAVGANACSFAMRSVHDTKETFLLVCIGFLEALDSLQTKLHLPTTLVKDLKRRLTKMVDRSLTRPLPAATCDKIQRAERMGERIAESDTWTDVAKPEEVRGFVHWLLAVMKWLNDLAFAGTIGACRRIFILILRFPGVPTACSLFCRIFEMAERTLRLGGSSAVVATPPDTGATQRKAKRPKLDHYMDDSSLTAVVLEYREKECMVPVNINRRIQQFMHFEIPLRSFEATVRLPVSHARRSGRATQHQQYTPAHATSFVADCEALDQTARSEQCASSSSSSSSSSLSSSGGPSSSSPRSIPASPRERRKFELIYSNYFDDVLYQARDKLRLQRAVNLTGERNRQIPRFNKHECDQEVHLTCGRNCAVKEGPGLYRSVRGTVPILRNRYVYFEMDLSSGPSPMIASGLVGHSGLLRSGPGGAGDEISACIGIAPRSMLLNTLVGTARHSVGLYSAGHIIVGGQQRTFKDVDIGYSCPSTVGVLVYIQDDSCANGSVEGAKGAMLAVARANVQFSVNGQAVRDKNGDIVVARFCFPSRVDLYPTVSLHTQGVRVYAQFSSPDIATFEPSSFVLSPDDVPEVVCLDGFRVPVSQSFPQCELES